MALCGRSLSAFAGGSANALRREMSVHIPFSERLTCTIDDACAVTGLGRTKLYELIKCERVATTKVGARTLVHVNSLISAVGVALDRVNRVRPNSDGSAGGVS